MSRYKVLVIGRNEALIDDLFDKSDSEIEFYSCSGRTGDITRHIDMLYPNVLLYCPNNDRVETLMGINNAKMALRDADVRVAIAGTAIDVKDFADTCGNMQDGAFVRPETVEELIDKVIRVANGEKFEVPADIERRASEEKNDKPAAKPTPAPMPAAPAAPTSTPTVSIVDDDVDSLLSSLAEKKHILIVDDDPIMLKTIQNTVEGSYNAATAVNGRVALKFLEKKHTDLILLDYEMPTMSGPEVLEELRKKPETANLPVVFLTGVSDSASIKKVLALGPQGYLLKPVDKEKLLATIRGVLKG